MASTTTSKKEIIDFLWEWTESHGDWSKQLIQNLVRSEDNLTPQARETIFNYFLQSIKLHTGLPPLAIVKPVYTPSSKKIELSSLSNVTGVNRLAKEQTINFSKNITVIYGENGTGKTGYGRILKTIGFSYDPNNNIYSNILENTQQQSAIIDFNTNGTPTTFHWDGNNKNSELQNISVFNSNCVQISLSSDRQLLVSPVGFHLFNLVSSELNELSKLLQAKITSYSTVLLWAQTLNEGTPQQIFINGLSGVSTETKLNELSAFSQLQEEELQQKERDFANLNKTLLQSDIQGLTAQESELSQIITKIQSAESLLSNDNWQKLIDLNKQIADLKGRTHKGIKEIAEAKGIALYETDEFQQFIQSAEEYIKILNNPEYPKSDDSCIYCKQPLENSAKELLQNYRALLNDTSQENIKKLNEQKTALIKEVSKVDSALILHQSSFGSDENLKAIQPNQITDYNKVLDIYKTIFITDKIEVGSTLKIAYDKLIEFLVSKKGKITLALKEKKEILANLDSKERELKIKIAELKDRKLLSTKVDEIKRTIANHKIIGILKANSNSFVTTAISRKTSDARQELVKQNFDEIFQEELKALRKSDIKIELNFSTVRGNSNVVQRIEKHALTDILSEGEQKAIALSEFLTELQLDNIKAPVIFDDPVNSLDHHIIDEVAKRFIELSKERQVIVFTHSILLLNNLVQQSELETNKQAGTEFSFLSVIRNFGETGLIKGIDEINSVKYYIGKVNTVLNTKPDGQSEATLAKEGYGHLRSAIEMTVEEEVLKKTIERYKKGVAFSALLRIEGSKIDEHKGKLNDIYEKCCTSINAHSNPKEVQTTPTISQLKMDLDELSKIRQNFKN